MSTPNNYEYVYIYALIDPRNNNVRYVGWTVDMENRMTHHFSPSSLKKETHKNNWLKQLLSLDLYPIVQFLETVPSEEYQIAERRWIAYYGRENLTNGTDGGDGAVGHIASEETKKKLSEIRKGKPKSEKHKENISKGKMGHTVSLESREKISKVRKENNICQGHKYSAIHQGYKKEGSSSKYMGVHWNEEIRKWVASMHYFKDTISLGYYTYEIEAALAYNECVWEYYGASAKLNQISQQEIDNLWNQE